MYDFENDREIIEYKFNDQGVPTHAATITPDIDPLILMDGFAAQFTMGGLEPGIRIAREPRLAHLNPDYYENAGPVSRLDEAWQRFALEFDPDEAREVFARYAAVFRPGVVVYSVNMQTGCSQGDWVDLILWLDESEIDKNWTEYTDPALPRNVRRAIATGQAYNCLKGICDEFEKAATGEVYVAAVHELEANMTLNGDPLSGEHTISFDLGFPVEDCGGFIGHKYAASEARRMLELI